MEAAHSLWPATAPLGGAAPVVEGDQVLVNTHSEGDVSYIPSVGAHQQTATVGAALVQEARDAVVNVHEHATMNIVGGNQAYHYMTVHNTFINNANSGGLAAGAAAARAPMYAQVDEHHQPPPRGNQTATIIVINETPIDIADGGSPTEAIEVVRGNLHLGDFPTIHQHVYDNRATGTGLWFLGTPAFKRWWRKKGRVLWATGMPGAGKTHIAACSIHHAIQKAETTKGVSVCYGYFQYSNQKSTVEVFQSLVRQQAEYFPPGAQLVAATIKRRKIQGRGLSQADCIDLIKYMSERCESWFYLDALNESPHDTQVDFLNLCATIPAKVCIFSQPLMHMQRYLQETLGGRGVTFTEIVAQDEDIELLVNQKIDSTPALRQLLASQPGLRKRISRKVIDNASGMFVHAALHIELIRHAPTVAKVESNLNGLPEGIYGIYGEMMKRIDQQSDDIAELGKKVLFWVARAERQLKVQEVQRALATDIETGAFDENSIAPEDQILAACCGLLTLTSEGEFRLVHLTALEPVRKVLQQWFPSPHSDLAQTRMGTLVSNDLTSVGIIEGARKAGDLEDRMWATRRTQYSDQTVTSGESDSTWSTAPKPGPPIMPHESTSTLVGSDFERQLSERGEKPDTTDRLMELRKLMERDTLDYYVVPSEDGHGSEHVAFSDKRREYISCFTGSSGTAIITRNNAYLVTDSRYWVQAEQEVDHNWTVIRAGAIDQPKDWIEWLLGRIRSTRIGIDARMISHEKATLISTRLPALDSKLVYPPQNLVDLVWKDKPEKSREPVYEQPMEYTGMDAPTKISKVRAWIKQQPPTKLPYSKREPTERDMHIGTLITALPQVAYLTNLRGADSPYNPLFHAYLYIGLDKSVLFLDSVKVKPDIAQYLQSIGVERRDYTELWLFLRRKEYGVGKLLFSPQTSYAISLMLTHSGYTIAPSWVEHMMAVKNEVEIDCMRRAYLRDGVSYVRFLAWLDQKLAEGYEITEYEAAFRLTEFRRTSKCFSGLPYANISASGPNAAMPHYVPKRSTARLIDKETPYVNDTGGLYRDGTCKTARTWHFGRPSAEQIDAYTRVLQGHIAIDSAVFPEGTCGHQLEVLARKPLWKDGLNDQHLPNHLFFTVHEISPGYISNLPLVPGHVTTNEPGFYLEGKWGIRIQSTLVVERTQARGAWLSFERLTCVPIQTKMVKESMLTKQERHWLKTHNQQCYDKLAPLLKDDKRALKWLKRESKIGLIAAAGGLATEWSLR